MLVPPRPAGGTSTRKWTRDRRRSLSIATRACPRPWILTSLSLRPRQPWRGSSTTRKKAARAHRTHVRAQIFAACDTRASQELHTVLLHVRARRLRRQRRRASHEPNDAPARTCLGNGKSAPADSLVDALRDALLDAHPVPGTHQMLSAAIRNLPDRSCLQTGGLRSLLERHPGIFTVTLTSACVTSSRRKRARTAQPYSVSLHPSLTPPPLQCPPAPAPAAPP